jgi:molybdate transport system substrate-binding protein
MTGLPRFFALIVAAAALGGAAPAAGAELVILCTQALRTSVQDLAPRFEQKTGHKTVVAVAPTGQLLQRVRQGEQADVLIASASGLRELGRENLVSAPSIAEVARAQVGIAIRAGAPRPDISSPDGVKRALLEASAVAYSQGGLSGNSFEGVLDKLGIKDAVKAKAKFGSPAAGFVVRGEADIAVQQIPELIAVQGAELVGPLPAELDQVTSFAAGMLSRAKQQDVAKAWLDFLAGPEAAAVIRSKGLSPAS